MSKFPVRVVREVTYKEVVDVEVEAKDKQAATNAAADFAEGSDVDWRTVNRYVVVQREPQLIEIMEIIHPDA